MTKKEIVNVSHETFHVQRRENIKIGKLGEEIACRHLIGAGHVIMSRNSKLGSLEFDIETTFHGKHHLYEIKTVAREKVSESYISREIFSASSRYSSGKGRNMEIGAEARGGGSVHLLCVAISMQDKKVYIQEIEVN